MALHYQVDSNLQTNLVQSWTEFRKLYSVGDYYSAFLRVAGVHGSLESLALEERVGQKALCDEVFLNEDVLKKTLDELEREERKIERILSHGHKWNVDEFILILTRRVQNDLLVKFLRSRGFSFSDPRGSTTSDTISQIGASPENRAAFATARMLARKNWGLPIRHPLLS